MSQLPKLDVDEINAMLMLSGVEVTLTEPEYLLEKPLRIPAGKRLQGHPEGTMLWATFPGAAFIFAVDPEPRSLQDRNYPAIDRVDVRPLKERPAPPDDPVEVWAEFCRRAEDAVASATANERSETMREWADAMAQLARQLAGVACPKCKGAGSRCYGSTATWLGGMGGASMTTDVCDRCWGTGRRDQKGIDRRRLESQLRSAERESSLRWFSSRIGANLSTLRAAFPVVAEKLRRARWRGHPESSAAQIIAHALDDMSGKTEEKEKEEEKP